MFALCKPQYHGCAPKGTPDSLVRIGVGYGKKWLLVYKSSNISETGQDSSSVTIKD